VAPNLFNKRNGNNGKNGKNEEKGGNEVCYH
jgi:hypothetical protein